MFIFLLCSFLFIFFVLYIFGFSVVVAVLVFPNKLCLRVVFMRLCIARCSFHGLHVCVSKSVSVLKGVFCTFGECVEETPHYYDYVVETYLL